MNGTTTGNQAVRRPRLPAVGLVAAALVVALGGCGAGQVAQTLEVTATGGAGGQVGSIVVRNAQIAYGRPIPGGAVYQPGDSAALQFTIVNDDTETIDDGRAPDRLIGVSSPIATSGRITGDARIVDGQKLTAGYDEPLSSVALPGTTTVDVTLVGLTEPIRMGINYPVVLAFERAGQLRLAVPVETPDILPPRAGENEPGELDGRGPA